LIQWFLAVVPLQWLVSIHCSGCRCRLKWLSFAAPVSVARSSSIGGSRGSSICCSQLQYLSLAAPVSVAGSSSICRSQLQYLWLQRLQYLSLEAPVSVAPVVALRDRLAGAVVRGSGGCRKRLQYLSLAAQVSVAPEAPVSVAGSSSICRSQLQYRDRLAGAVVRGSGGCHKRLQYLSLAAPVSGLRYKLKMMGVPIDGPAIQYHGRQYVCGYKL